MAKDLSKEWLQINRICKEVKWLSWDPDYKDLNLEVALSVLEKLKSRIEQQMNN